MTHIARCSSRLLPLTVFQLPYGQFSYIDDRNGDLQTQDYEMSTHSDPQGTISVTLKNIIQGVSYLFGHDLLFGLDKYNLQLEHGSKVNTFPTVCLYEFLK